MPWSPESGPSRKKPEERREPAETAAPTPEVKVPEKQHAETAEEQNRDAQLALVRLRLRTKGAMTRRALFRTFSAAAVTAGMGIHAESARAEEVPVEEPSTETLMEYARGVAELRESARTDVHEQFRIFLMSPRGDGEWIMPQTQSVIRQTGEQSAQNLLVVQDSRQLMNRLRDRLLQGDRVEYLHTHPTAGFTEALELASTLPNTDWVPPSYIDLLSMAGETSDMREADRARWRFRTVTESGIWDYGIQNNDRGRAFLETMSTSRPALTALQALSPQESRAAAQALRRFWRRQNLIPEAEATIEGVADSIEREQLPEQLLRNSAQFPGITFIIPPASDIPDQAERYFSILNRAYSDLTTAFARHDPDGPGFLTMATMPPEARDFDSYVERWQSLGVDLRFSRFDTSALQTYAAR